MAKCKSSTCENETVGKRIYCSASCRTRTTNRLYKDYSKAAKPAQDQYAANPRFCEECRSQLSFGQRRNRFCGQRCSAIVLNRKRKEDGWTRSAESRLKTSTTLLRAYDEGRLQRKHSLKNRRQIYVDYEVTKNCAYCGCDFLTNNLGKAYCSGKCSARANGAKRRPVYRDDITLKDYRLLCRFDFHLKDYADRIDLSSLYEHGMYSAKNRGNNADGVSRDHMYSVRDGYDNKVHPSILAHPANCQLVIHRKNASKGRKSVITLDELKARIESWEAGNDFKTATLDG